MAGSHIVLAGATGNLGGRIARELIARGAPVRALVRRESAGAAGLRDLGAEVVEVDHASVASLERACRGATCVVSALAGLRDVVVDAQATLLDAAVAAGVPRFVPSDYCIDFTKLEPGTNRNLDMRREFAERVDQAPIAATSVLNGAFADLLTGPAPIVLQGPRLVLYWHDADQPMDFTTVDDAAAYTAAVALDQATPRWLRVAGDRISARGLAALASELTGRRFRLLRAGGLGRLSLVIRIARLVAPGTDELYPPWQGMQYLRDMFGGRALLAPLDNERYGGMRWTPVRDVLAPHLAAGGGGAAAAA